ncbi:hypothetical protein [Streptomyces sasae]|uniref:hypothetical protein n=1 Tax=Streptomyces sasae TaxID=1266772 RepID=UPI0029313149|nr:hypothetical protein [Streptomyces sasae]
MLRHEFQPGRLVVGVFLTVTGIAYAGDAADWWHIESFAAAPVMVAGLFLAGVTAALARAIRRRGRAPKS